MKEPRQIFKRGILNIYVRIYIDARFVYTAKYRETKGSFLNERETLISLHDTTKKFHDIMNDARKLTSLLSRDSFLLFRKNCTSCKCPREAHDVCHEEWVSVRSRLGLKGEESSCPATFDPRGKGLAWAPPGLPAHKVGDRFSVRYRFNQPVCCINKLSSRHCEIRRLSRSYSVDYVKKIRFNVEIFLITRHYYTILVNACGVMHPRLYIPICTRYACMHVWRTSSFRYFPKYKA